MPLPDSQLAWLCRSLADFIGQRIQADQNRIRVMIGSPSDAAPDDGDHDHRLNLLFYRFEPSPAPRNIPMVPEGRPLESQELERVSVHCLITAFGVPEGGVSAGENDLRLLGEVLRIFQEQPVFEATRGDGRKALIQVALHDLTVEKIHDLWSTQGAVGFRPSVALLVRSDSRR